MFGDGIQSVVGRYELRRVVGEGGGGTVFAAHDPELEREVAVKILRGPRRYDLDDDGRNEAADRLVREAKALARVCHHNLVKVLDGGTYSDGTDARGVPRRSPYIVMELVNGVSMARWLKQPRQWFDIVDVVLQIGRGLAAVHRHGLVHRDVKPGNVLIDETGVARLGDFGLARALMERVEPTLEPVSDSDPLTCEITPSGFVVGTPGFIAPELLHGERPTARSDQFALAMTLHRGLFGRTRPGNTDRRDRNGRRVPRWLMRTLRRALHADPHRRYPCVEAMVADLDPRRVRKRRFIVIAAMLTLVALAGLSRVLAAPDFAPCDPGDADIESTWNAEVADELRRAFVKNSPRLGPAATRFLEGALDDYTRRWKTGWSRSCERATRNRGAQQLHALASLNCLRHRTHELGGFLSVLRAPTPVLIERVHGAVRTLPPVEACTAERLMASDWGSAPVATVRRSAQIRHELGQVRAMLELTGNPQQAAEQMSRLFPRVEELGDSALLADSLLTRASIARSSSDSKHVHEYCERALWLAIEADDLNIVTRAQVCLAYASLLEEKFDETLEWANRARSTLERIEHPIPGVPLLVQQALASAYRFSGRYEEALKHLRRGLELAKSEPFPDQAMIAALHSEAGVDLALLGRLDEGLSSQERALALRRRVLGPDHPSVARSLHAVGANHFLVGRENRGQPLIQSAIDSLTRTQGPDSSLLARPYNNLGELHRSQGRIEAALEAHREAIRLRRMHYGPTSYEASLSLRNLSMTLLALGRLAEAREGIAETLRIRERLLGPDHPRTARVRIDQARMELLTEDGDPAAALELASSSLRTLERLFPRSHPARAMGHAVLGRALHANGAFDEAFDHYQRALVEQATQHVSAKFYVPYSYWGLGTLLEEQGQLDEAGRHFEALSTMPNPGPMWRARAYFGLARVDQKRGRHESAVSNARRAALYAASLDPRFPLVSRIEQWLARHGSRPSE